ncbi:MAG: hypothetical protein K1X67_00345 [Fimbriimonadaceae bacterium]|nr:hypothetical protein [Fimbriimonadaceae bacterium]
MRDPVQAQWRHTGKFPWRAVANVDTIGWRPATRGQPPARADARNTRGQAAIGTFQEHEYYQSLRGKLYSRARWRGFSHEDSEDLASDVVVRIHEIIQTRDLDPSAATSYAYKALDHLMMDRRESPERRLAKRLNAVLKRPNETDPIEQWDRAGASVVGLRSQARLDPATDHDLADLNSRLSDFMYGAKGLDGVNPHQVSTKLLIGRLLNWLGRPITRSALLSYLAPMVPVPDTVGPLPPEDGGPYVRESDPETDLTVCWGHIIALPPRMRASVLLKMDEDLLEKLHPNPREALAEAITDWPPPPPITEVDLPVGENTIAEKLGITVNYLQVLRNRAKHQLLTTLAPFLAEAMGAR